MPDLLNRMTADEIFDRLESASPEIAKFRAKDREKIDKQRSAAAASLVEIAATFDPKILDAGTAKRKAESESEKMRKAHQAAVGAAFQASQQVFSLEATKTRLIGQQVRILRETADPRIRRLYREISDALSEPFGQIAEGAGEPALPATKGEMRREHSEWEHRVARVERQRAALKELDALELEAIEGAELTKRLASIRARALPANGYHSIKL